MENKQNTPAHLHGNKEKLGELGDQFLGTMLDELSMADYELTHFKDRVALMFSNPLCGTCQLAKYMLGLALYSFSNRPLPTYICRIAEWPKYVEKWKIKSVPCLIIAQGDEVIDTIYAFESVTKLYNTIKKYGSIER
jgi:hypothetical protein